MNDTEDIRYRRFREEPAEDSSASNLNSNVSTQELQDESRDRRLHCQNLTTSSDTSDDRTPLVDSAGYMGPCGFFCNPQSICHKAIALALMCSVGFGSYFCYDNPGALQVNKCITNDNRLFLVGIKTI